MPKAKITALGCYTPPKLLTNQDLEKMVDTNEEWILSRVGIRERHIAGPRHGHLRSWPSKPPAARWPSAASKPPI